MSRIIDLFNEDEQLYLLSQAHLSGDLFYKDMLGWSDDISEYCAWALSQFVHSLESNELKESIMLKAKALVYSKGFEYQWHKQEFSETRKESHQAFFRKLTNMGIDFGNIVMNKTPIEGFEAFLDYGTHIEVFFFDEGMKKDFKSFRGLQEAYDYYEKLLCRKKEYFITRIHYTDADEKAFVLRYAKKLEDELAYEIFSKELEIKDAQTARHIKRFFWDMVDEAAYDYHEAPTQKERDNAYADEAILNTIGGFISRCGFRYEWDANEIPEVRQKAAKQLQTQLEALGFDKGTLTINATPKDQSYCFLDYGDAIEYFYYQDYEQMDTFRSFKDDDFDTLFEKFKAWAIAYKAAKTTLDGD